MVILLIVTYVLGALAAMRVAYVADARTQDEPSWRGAAMWGLVWPGVVLHRLVLLIVRAIGWMLRQTLYRETKYQRERRLEREKKLAHETAILELHKNAPELLSYEHKQEVLEILDRKKNEALLAKWKAEMEKQTRRYYDYY